jgi:preprotein translocase subunit SecF
VYTLGTGANRSLEVEADLSSLSPSAQSAKERQVSTDLAKAGGVSFSSVSLTNVGPTWGSDVTSKALEALAFFFLGIVLYISVRFEWKMALAALVAVVHDLLVTVGIYSISNFQITPATVIAVLTILGYSLYDTIVVFDRVQENVKTLVNPGRLTYDEAVDLSLNQVLMRSLNTSLVAIIPVLSILVVGAYILGATTLQDFGLALFVGLTTGAYSSIAIASPVLAWLKGREPRYKALAARLGERSTHLSPRSVAQGALSQGVGGASSDTARPPRPRSSNSKRKARSKR